MGGCTRGLVCRHNISGERLEMGRKVCLCMCGVHLCVPFTTRRVRRVHDVCRGGWHNAAYARYTNQLRAGLLKHFGA